MIFAAIGDIRGNVNALQCVMDTVMQEGIQTVVNTGDNVVGHASPHEVIEVLCRESIAGVQGEYDRLLGRWVRKRASLRERLPEADFKALERAYEQCSSRDLEYLASLPSRLSLAFDGVSIELCHGALTGPSDRLGPKDDPALFRRQRELTAAQIIVCGHGEEAFALQIDDTLFVNPGSVGMASDGRAHYAVISTETEPWHAELRSAEYESVQNPG